MSTTKLKLTNPTDDELSAAVAEYVAGWRWIKSSIMSLGGFWSQDGMQALYPKFATSVDAVLPLTMQPLNGRKFYFVSNYLLDGWRAWVEFDPFTRHEAKAATFPRAACIALLRANGIEVEQTAPAQK